MKKTMLLIGLILMHTSVSAKIIVDKSGVDEKDYIYDLHQCTEYSQQVEKQAADGGVVSGAAKGAALGAAAGAISGGSGSDGAKTGAAVGVVGGFLGKSRSKRQNQQSYEQEQTLIIKNCMTNRGYVVLN